MKNWTLRQRILASFAVIIAIMLLMIVAAYSRLVTIETAEEAVGTCLLYTSPSPRDQRGSRMPSSA